MIFLVVSVLGEWWHSLLPWTWIPLIEDDVMLMRVVVIASHPAGMSARAAPPFFVSCLKCLLIVNVWVKRVLLPLASHVDSLFDINLHLLVFLPIKVHYEYFLT